MLVLEWVVFSHGLELVYEIWWQQSVHNMKLCTTDARQPGLLHLILLSMISLLIVGVERKIQPPLLSLPFMNVTETILTLGKKQFFLSCKFVCCYSTGKV